jgi:hypothetical protein
LLLVTFGAKVELYAGQLFTVRGSPSLLSFLSEARSFRRSIRLRTGAAFWTGMPGPLYRTVRLTEFGDSLMSKVMRFLDPSSPVISIAWIEDVSLGSGDASDAPESIHLRSAALNSITLVLDVLTRTASLVDQGSKMGFSDAGAAEP